MRQTVFTVPLAVLVSTTAWAQSGIAQPGQEAAEHEAEQRGAAEGQTQPAFRHRDHVPSYEAPPTYETVVRGEFKEDDAIGDYQQPRWTGARLFPTTRIYVLPGNAIQLEYWLDTKMAFENADEVRFRTLYEVEIGLGHRLQLDFYLRTQQKGIQGPMELESEKVELRYAFADWDTIPGNPTLYLELSRFDNGPPTLEAKLLLGGSLAPRLHWGLNLVFERDLAGDDLFNQYGITGGLAYAVVDRKFSAGLEVQVESQDGGRTARELAEISFLAGPTMQWRPVPPVHIDLVALFGALGERAGNGMAFKAGMRPLLVVGWEL